MKKVWKNYKGTILLLLGVIIGGILGLIFKEKVKVLKPLGDLYMNLMFVIIVPLIFLLCALKYLNEVSIASFAYEKSS